MTRFIWLILIVVSLEACTAKHEAAEISAEIAADNLKVVPLKYKGKFVLHDIKAFKFTYDDIKRLGLVQIDSLAFVELLQHDELLKYNQTDRSHYYYSLQKRNGKYRSATIVVNRDFDYVIFNLVYADDGKLISRFEVAGEGGDGRFSYASFGTFSNDSTYLLTKIEREISEGDSSVLETKEKRVFRLAVTGRVRH